MKLYHFCIIFTFLSLTLFVITDVKICTFTAAAEEKEMLNHSFDRAIDDAVTNLVETDGIAGLKLNKERAVDDFYSSLYASLGILDKPDKQALIKNYIPLITVTCEDGYYVYYCEEYKGSDGCTYINKHWSEKKPYYYEDRYFIYGFTLTDIITVYDKNKLLDPSGEQAVFTVNYHDLQTNDRYKNFRNEHRDSFLLNDEDFYLIRKNCIITGIEKSLRYYCNKYNSIAQLYSITYNFSMPVVDNSEWTRSIDNPSMIVLFQGYPFGNSVIGTYNRFLIAGARIKKKEAYYLEQKEWYYLYHKSDCSELKKGGIYFFNNPYYSILDCAKEGAYACPVCSDRTGVPPPNYDP